MESVCRAGEHPDKHLHPVSDKYSYGHIHEHTERHAHRDKYSNPNPHTDGYCDSGSANGNPDPTAVRVPDARPAADAPGGEHDLADR